MNRTPGNVHILITVLVASATMPHRLTALKIQKKPDLRVYQGVHDVTTKYPYVVILQPFRVCTGSLITPEWVVTAGHCCIIKPSYIQYGILSIPINMTASKSEVIEIVLHPRFESSPFSHVDIALLRVSTAVRMDKYGTLSAVDYSTQLGLAAEYVGGGGTFIPKRNSRNKIIKYTLDFLRPLQIGQGVISPCKSAFRGLICVSPKCSIKQMTMPGDSGGPLLVDDKIVGITNGGPGENFYDNSDRFFLPISPHQEWIRNVITSKPN